MTKEEIEAELERIGTIATRSGVPEVWDTWEALVNLIAFLKHNLPPSENNSREAGRD